MPEDGYYAKVPRPESIDAVRRCLSRHGAVRDRKEITPQLYEISRIGKSAVTLFVTNVYTVGVADVQEIAEEHPSVTCILTVSAWNSYTRQAKEYARSINIGLFRFYEWMGALNYDRDEFLDYIAPSDR
ncbi:hypothetical protein QF026_004050 [Streptomyces aurantiacus]|uniref:hypothetical protein n=1 Tax=Streptomyces aurantiacus TaxID=47760 RepID=UPI0027918C8F|nr:hypothetical protein [Streptomyces aurantiacus]MDQ0775584.1 hypothetical protein [Streptomyces aurantiacus]